MSARRPFEIATILVERALDYRLFIENTPAQLSLTVGRYLRMPFPHFLKLILVVAEKQTKRERLSNLHQRGASVNRAMQTTNIFQRHHASTHENQQRLPTDIYSQLRETGTRSMENLETELVGNTALRYW